MKTSICKKSAFLLIEHLIAISILGMSLLLVLSILRLLTVAERKIAIADSIEWHLMITQLDTNLSGQGLQEATRFLYLNQVKKDGIETVVKLMPSTPKKSAIVISKNRGYQPLLIGYQQMHLYRKGPVMRIEATLMQGGEFQLDFLPAKRVITVYRE